jgi:PAS domain S-box-containing protein
MKNAAVSVNPKVNRNPLKPVKELARGMEEVSKGNLDHKIEIKSKDEIGELADIFNKMAQDLQKSNHEIQESEKRYRTLFESAGDAIFILDGEGEKAGHIVAANKAAAEMHGYSVNELLALNITDLDAPDAAKEVPGRIQRMLKGERIKAEIPHLKKDGTVFPVEVNAGLLEIGDYKFILAFDRDITERKRAEGALRESEERYRSLFENSPISLWEEDFSDIKKYLDDLKDKGVKDIRAYFDNHPEEVALCAGMVKVIDVNKTTMTMFKARDKGEIISGLNKVFTEKSYGVFKEELIALAEGKITFECEAIVKTLTGNEMYISLRWSEVPGHEKTSSVRLLVSIMDITERKQAEEAIKKYAAKLEESNRLKELFTDVMHHDLLNPLNVAAGYIELLRDEETSPKKIATMERIERNLTKGMELIESATMFSKLESMERIEFVTIDLKEVIERVIDALNPLVTKAGMTIENSIDGSMLVRGNKIIEEVFANFLSNAVKYAPKGKKIIVEGEDMGEFWRIKVIDFGEGIKDADKAMIFERFRMMEKKGVKGSGLGLAIARKIVELHKGRIWVEDNPEGGAVFVVEMKKLSV